MHMHMPLMSVQGSLPFASAPSPIPLRPVSYHLHRNPHTARATGLRCDLAVTCARACCPCTTAADLMRTVPIARGRAFSSSCCSCDTGTPRVSSARPRTAGTSGATRCTRLVALASLRSDCTPGPLRSPKGKGEPPAAVRRPLQAGAWLCCRARLGLG